jgi:hypothetical protein
MFKGIAHGGATDIKISFVLVLMAAVSLVVVYKTVQFHRGARLMGFVLAWSVLGAVTLETSFCLHIVKSPDLFSMDYFILMFLLSGINLIGYGGAVLVFTRRHILLRLWREK